MKLLIALLASTACLANVGAGYRVYRQKDYARAVREWSDDAARGNSDGQYHLGLLYRDGEGVPKDLARAASLFEKSSKQGHSDSSNELGLLYLSGKGVAPDDARALQLFTQAFPHSSAALFNIGLMHEKGWGVPISSAEACAWFTVAAEQGSRGAPQKRDTNCANLNPADRHVASGRMTAIRRDRWFRWLGTDGLYWAAAFRNAVAFIAGVYGLYLWAANRFGWHGTGKPENSRQYYREVTRSRFRRWFLWHRLPGVMAWILHLLFFATLAVTLVTFAVLPAIPFGVGSVGLALLLLGALSLAHAAAAARDRRVLWRRARSSNAAGPSPITL